MAGLPPNIPTGLNPPSAPPMPAQFSVLIFLNHLASPVVLYADNPAGLYDELKQILKSATPQAPKLIEKPGVGPLKKVVFLDTDLRGVALQADPTSRGR